MESNKEKTSSIKKEDEIIVPEIEDSFLEKHLIIKGFVSKKYIEEAKKKQKALLREGKKVSLAYLMFKYRFVTLTQLKRIKALEKGVDDEIPQIEGYEIIKKIRKGGMGTVYKAKQLSMDRVVALKILAPELTDDETYVKRFLTEAKAVGKLNHENIVAGYDAGQSNGYYFFAMEYINGETILDIMKREKIVSVPFALNVTYQTAKALEHAAKHKIIHRDIKPGNIMINHKGVIKLCDLGFAKISNIDLLLRKGTTLGTPYYMSPEQCRGLPDIDTRSDIYSLGATLYHMVVGKVPFPGRTASEILRKHITEKLVIPQERRAAIGEYVCHIIEKMMAKKREDRYSTPTELLNELEPIMARFKAPKILIIYPMDIVANDLALLIATGAYEQGGKVEIVRGEDVKAEQLREAGAIIIGSIDKDSNIPLDIRGVLEIMQRFSKDMKGKLGSAFIAHYPSSSLENSYTQLQIIFNTMMNLGMIVQGTYDDVIGGQKAVEDPDSEDAEKFRNIGNSIATLLLQMTAGREMLHRAAHSGFNTNL